MAHVAALWRHPIKSHGREELQSVVLTAGQTMPWDRHWAVTHDNTKVAPGASEWAVCKNFMIGSTTPGLAGIWAQLDEETRSITLSHADLGSHSFEPDNPDDWAGFQFWVMPLCPADKPQPKAIVTAGARGMTDTPAPTISIMNSASHDAVVERSGLKLGKERWRGNIWIDGLKPWAEDNWIGKTVRIGDAELAVEEPIVRCKATTANPHTGIRDVDTLRILREGWDHQNFGVYAVVTKTGKVAVNDTVEVL